jgi:hypothetical protein
MLLALAAAWLTLAQSSSLTTVPQHADVVTSAAGVTRVTRHLHAAEAARVRKVDYAKRSVVAAFVRMATPCNRVAVTGWSRKAGTLTVHVEIREPSAGMVCTQVIATGYHVLSVPRLAPPQRVLLRVG